MNEVIYGQNIAKMEILEYLVSSSKSRIIGLTGSAGVGKTTLIKNALSKCFNNRPFYYISLGGITDVKILAGSAPVWKGATSGRLVDALIETQCMNPIIYFDEVDKVGINSNIHEYLIHLIDPVYNTHIYNNFLDINIDFSKVMFVFSYNNKNLINKILLDRIKMVEMKDYTKDEMVIICEKYIIPQILDEMKMPNNLFNFDTDIIRFINTKITDKNKSMRPVIRLYQDIISKIYMNYIINRNNKNTVLGSLYKMNIKIKNGSINITEELINNII
jgi:ATP-dependent Lon protease